MCIITFDPTPVCLHGPNSFILLRENQPLTFVLSSFGLHLRVIVFILLGGYPPFYADSPRELLRMTKAGQYEFDPEYWGQISSGAKDMISSLLQTDPAKRASAEDVLSHP